MVDSTLTHLYPVLDRSGSMHKHKADTEGGFDAFIAEQRQLPGKCLVTLAQFNDTYEIVYAGLDVNEVPPLKMRPGGKTALLDAIGHTITAAGNQLRLLPEAKRPGSVIVPILTDGEENASVEYTLLMIHEMIKRQTEDYSWLFTYIGANQDAIRVGGQLGVDRAHTMSFNQVNTQDAFAAMATSSGLYRGARAAGQSYAQSAAAAAFTDDQRAQATGAGK